MKKVLFLVVLMLLVSSVFAEEGKVLIDCKNKGATLYVDGEKNITITEKLTPLVIEEGTHVFKVVEPINEQCQKYGEKELYVSSSVKLTL